MWNALDVEPSAGVCGCQLDLPTKVPQSHRQGLQDQNRTVGSLQLLFLPRLLYGWRTPAHACTLPPSDVRHGPIRSLCSIRAAIVPDRSIRQDRGGVNCQWELAVSVTDRRQRQQPSQLFAGRQVSASPLDVGVASCRHGPAWRRLYRSNSVRASPAAFRDILEAVDESSVMGALDVWMA